MKRVMKLSTPPRFISYAAVGGREESNGPYGSLFDLCDPSDKFGQKTWELSEGEMGRCALNLALSKSGLSHEVPELIIAGDLQNQCVASSVGLDSFGIPYLGIYGACSTCTEALLIMSAMLSLGEIKTGATVTTSHNAASERQFRTPLEYGGQRSPSAQWTATAGGAFIISNDENLISSSENGHVEIADIMAGKIVDGAITDATNMGGAMAFSAIDSILTYFEQSGYTPRDFDYIVTGDLGKVGSGILREVLDKKLPEAAVRHRDCGMLLYDMERSDVHSGASGCGASASLLACYFLPMLERGDIKNMLLLSTGALMSPSSVLQGSPIKGITPAIHLRHVEKNLSKNGTPPAEQGNSVNGSGASNSIGGAEGS